jgi:hypothetical protein
VYKGQSSECLAWSPGSVPEDHEPQPPDARLRELQGLSHAGRVAAGDLRITRASRCVAVTRGSSARTAIVTAVSRERAQSASPAIARLRIERPIRTTAHAGMPLTCENCHTTNAWRPAALDHARFFPLEGAHRTLQCDSCHRGGVFAGTPSQCVGCHQANYNATSNPNHAQSGFPTTCDNCHTTAAWRPASFDHARFFPLEGAHRTLQCDACHRGGVFTGAPSQCVGCHQANYNSTTNPNHAQSGFPTTCESCHSTNAWRPAAFDHARFFPLEGAHRTLQCDACHRGGVYAGTPSQCVGCHQTQYNATNESESRAERVPDDLRRLSHDQCLAAGQLRPRSFLPGPTPRGSNQCQDCHTTGKLGAVLVHRLPRARSKSDGQQASRGVRLPVQFSSLFQLPSERPRGPLSSRTGDVSTVARTALGGGARIHRFTVG